MKKFFTITALLIVCLTMSVKAQFSVNLQAGYNQNTTDGFTNNTGQGLCNSIDVMYSPHICDDKLSLGISQNGVFFFSTDPYFISSTKSPQASKFFLTGVKIRYDFSNAKVHPFISLLTGFCDVRSNAVLNIGMLYSGEYTCDPYKSNFVTECIFSTEKRYLGFNPEIGISVGRMYYSIGYTIPKEWTEMGQKYKYSHIQISVGFHLSKQDTNK